MFPKNSVRRQHLAALFLVGFIQISTVQKIHAAGRVVELNYRESEVVHITTRVLQPLLIEFPNGEVIEDVAIGRPEDWEVNRRPNKVFIRALESAGSTTIIITTSDRTLVCDLSSLKNATPKEFVTWVRVLSGSKAGAVSRKPAMEKEGSLGELRLDDGPLARNYDYSLQVISETVDISPKAVFDDGVFTYFDFPKNMPIPAVFRGTLLGQEEWLVNSHRQGDYLVLHTVSPLWILRLEGSNVGVFNNAYDPMGNVPEGNTFFPGKRRILK